MLYVVALPIGNVQDLGLRAQEILTSVDYILCEDTRCLGQWMSPWSRNNKALGKGPRKISFHEHNQVEKKPWVIKQMHMGCSFALVSDAGTPLISDPGFPLVVSCYEEGLSVVPVPGPCAVTAALSICPIGGSAAFYFGGFLPSKSSQRLKALQSIAVLPVRKVFFESPYRLKAHLKEALTIFGNKKVFLARELSKPYEETFWLPIRQVLDFVC